MRTMFSKTRLGPLPLFHRDIQAIILTPLVVSQLVSVFLYLYMLVKNTRHLVNPVTRNIKKHAGAHLVLVSKFYPKNHFTIRHHAYITVLQKNRPSFAPTRPPCMQPFWQFPPPLGDSRSYQTKPDQTLKIAISHQIEHRGGTYVRRGKLHIALVDPTRNATQYGTPELEPTRP